MLEKMDAFFDARLEGYEEHMLTNIESAGEFYPFTAGCLPIAPGTRLLDLGCGTGLELNWYFALVPDAAVTGIDLAPGMLARLAAKFPDKNLTLIQGSYFELPLGTECYDAAVSVESAHHFTQAEKTRLFRKLHAALRSGGFFILTDYFAHEDAFEEFCFRELKRLRAEQNITDDAFYHYDTPLTLAHEIQALRDAGFSNVRVLGSWGATHTLKAEK